MASTEFDDPRRQVLLKQLKDTLSLDTTTPTVWACLWLSDIDKLEDIVAIAKEKPFMINTTLAGVEPAKIVSTWTQRKRVGSTTSTPAPRSPLGQGSDSPKLTSSRQLVITRSKQQRDLCHKRDQKKCVLTKAAEPNEVAHIYPFSMRYENYTIERPKSPFWSVLRNFWSQKQVDDWYNAIFSNLTSTEICQNLLCLCPNAHAYWERAYFALKPIEISDDEKRLDVLFFWLSSNPRVPRVNILQAPSSPASDHGPDSIRLFNNDTYTVIKSGDKISLKTDDPVSQPLPNYKLLEMQWFLHRVTAMSGAAEPQNDFYDVDSDDDIATGLQDRWGMYPEDELNMEIEAAPERFQEALFHAQPFGAHSSGHVITLRGGGRYRERQDYQGEDYEGDCREGEDRGR